MESKQMELPATWLERIEVDAKARWPLHVGADMENEKYRKAYEAGAMVYAPWLYTCQMNYATLRARAEKMEQALKEFQNWNYKLALEVSRLKGSMEAHPDFVNGEIEFVDRVARAEKTLAGWKKAHPQDREAHKAAIDWYRNPGRGPAWVKATNRLPGWDQVVKWRHEAGEELPGMSTISDLTDNGFATLDGMEWRDDEKEVNNG